MSEAAVEPKVFVQAGKLFCFSEGEYSDYGYVGHFLALEAITSETFARAKERCLVRVRAGEGESCGCPPDLEDENDVNRAMRDLFLPELVRMGVVMDIDCTTIHVGSYGQLDL